LAVCQIYTGFFKKNILFYGEYFVVYFGSIRKIFVAIISGNWSSWINKYGVCWRQRTGNRVYKGIQLQYLEWCIYESVSQKSEIIKPSILKQFEIFVNYIDQEFTKVDWPLKTLEERNTFIKNVHVESVISKISKKLCQSHQSTENLRFNTISWTSGFTMTCTIYFFYFFFVRHIIIIIILLLLSIIIICIHYICP